MTTTTTGGGGHEPEIAADLVEEMGSGGILLVRRPRGSLLDTFHLNRNGT